MINLGFLPRFIDIQAALWLSSLTSAYALRYNIIPPSCQLDKLSGLASITSEYAGAK